MVRDINEKWLRILTWVLGVIALYCLLSAFFILAKGVHKSMSLMEPPAMQAQSKLQHGGD